MRYFRIVQRKSKKTSPLQLRRKRAFTKAANYRTQLVDQCKIPLWINYANTHPIATKHQKKQIINWWNWYMRINIYRVYNGLDVILDPPDD